VAGGRELNRAAEAKKGAHAGVISIQEGPEVAEVGGSVSIGSAQQGFRSPSPAKSQSPTKSFRDSAPEYRTGEPLQKEVR